MPRWLWASKSQSFWWLQIGTVGIQASLLRCYKDRWFIVNVKDMRICLLNTIVKDKLLTDSHLHVHLTSVYSIRWILQNQTQMMIDISQTSFLLWRLQINCSGSLHLFISFGILFLCMNNKYDFTFVSFNKPSIGEFVFDICKCYILATLL